MVFLSKFSKKFAYNGHIYMTYDPIRLEQYFKAFWLTWCKAVSPSTLAVLISAPIFSRRCTSSLSPDVHAAKKTIPAENWILEARFGVGDCLFVSDSSHLLSCSARLNNADDDLLSVILTSESPPLTRYGLHQHFSHGIDFVFVTYSTQTQSP